jgi:inorganic pyrophosphatase/solute carrier family 25 iron transporter 28/37
MEKRGILKNYPGLLYFCCGIIAETVACVLWVPVDVIKERMQVHIFQARDSAIN